MTDPSQDKPAQDDQREPDIGSYWIDENKEYNRDGCFWPSIIVVVVIAIFVAILGYFFGWY